MLHQNILHQALDLIQTPVLVLDHKGIRYHNSSAALALASLFQNQASLVGLTFKDCQLTISRCDLMACRRNLLHTGQHRATLTVSLAGAAFEVDMAAQVTSVDGQNKDGLILTLFRFEKKVAAAPKKKMDHQLLQLLRDMPFMCVLSNQNGVISYANELYADFVGIPLNELIGRNYFDFIPLPDQKRIEQQIRRLAESNDFGLMENRMVNNGRVESCCWFNRVVGKHQDGFDVLSIGYRVSDRSEWLTENRELRQAYRELIERVEYAIFVVNTNLEVEFANTVAVRYFEAGNVPHGVKPGILFDLSKHTTAKEYLEILDKNSKKVPPKIIVYGPSCIFERLIFPVFRNGQIVSMIVEVRKVHDFNREYFLQSIQGELPQSILDSASICVLRMNRHMEIIYLNMEAAKVVGCEPYELIGKKVADMLHPSCYASSVAKFQRLVNQEVSTYSEDVQVYVKDGSLVWLEVVVTRTDSREDDDMLFTASFNDITARKKQEKFLEKRIKDVSSRNEKLERFYSIIGHDIKSPFISIQLIANSLYLQAEQSKDEFSLKYLGYIKQLADNGLSLLDNLITWTKSTMEGVTYNPVLLSLYRLFNEESALFNIAAAAKDIRVINKVDPLLQVHGDANLIKTIMRNLLSNAIKYSNPNGCIIVDTKISGEWVQVSVTDHGVGIDPVILNKIFDISTEKVVAGTSNEIGSGLGLQICKTIVNRMGGDIRVESVKGKGTTVTFTIRHAVSHAK